MLRILVIPIFCFLTACSTTVPMPYAIVQELSLANLQRVISEFFDFYPAAATQSGHVASNSACLYPQHEAFYQQGLSEAHTLMVRAQVSPNNQTNLPKYEALLGSLYDLRTQHQQACFTGTEVARLQKRFDKLLAAIVE